MKKLLLLLPVVLIASCKFTEAPSAGLAKEMCSCLFISGQTQNYCEIVTKESQILANFEADYNRKEVIAKGAGFVSMAKLDDNARYGCSLKWIKRDPESQERHAYHGER
jgi:hypothetical protein